MRRGTINIASKRQMEENQRIYNHKHNFTSYNFQSRHYLAYKSIQNLLVAHLLLPSNSKYITLDFLVGDMQNCQQEVKCYA